MTRGRLRVLLGAAPGVGKTYTMLEEGVRLRDEGKDVVVAIVESHGRRATAAMAEKLPHVPRTHVEHRGVTLWEMDLAAVLERHPDVALVDELAHTNAPGSTNAKRWQDIQDLLAAGIDVISTVNIQHIESLNDVVRDITGVPQRETVPDQFVRTAHQIEVVDLDPQALRDRLSMGLVYPAERIDAALSNYFRLGNLTALRELALIWLADEVDQALQAYRSEHGIGGKWEARERVVVALTAGPEGETLLRRGARIASRSGGGELVAVHVISQDGLREGDPDELAKQRSLVEELGGTFHQVVGDDVPTALVEFARSVNATQLVLGASRRSRFAALLEPGIGATVIRESADIDVHIVTHAEVGHRFRLPRIGGSLTLRRRLLGFAATAIGTPLLTMILTATRSPESTASDVLLFQLLVVVVALIGGIWPALVAAIACGVALDFFLIDPIHTVTISDPRHSSALVLSLLIAALVSFVVDRAVRRTRAAQRSAAEAELLQTIAGSVLRGEDAVQALIERTREALGLDEVVLWHEGRVLASSTQLPDPAGRHGTTQRIEVDADSHLEIGGSDLSVSEKRILNVVTTQLGAALQHTELVEAADEIAAISSSDRVRGALLSALSHDVRRPLAAAAAAVGGLRTAGSYLDDADRAELISTAEESLHTLSNLMTDLLDVSRLQAGTLAVTTHPTDIASALMPALDEIGAGPGDVELALDPDVPPVMADAVLLQRVLVNLLDNARRHSDPDDVVRVSTSEFDSGVQIRVIDHGPGIPPDRRDDVFIPFQRMGDSDNSTGLGLGLALSKGFVEGMGGTLEPEDTPGGGVTMVVELPAAWKSGSVA